MKVDDVRRIVSALNDAGVKYLIVDGLAVAAHGYVRFTHDVDLVVHLERENVLLAMHALTAIGYRPLAPVSAADFADDALRQRWREEKGMIVFQLFSPDRESTRLDIFVYEPFAFAEEYGRAKWYEWGSLRAPVLRLEALIAMKEAAGRPVDIADLAMLYDIMRLGRGEIQP